MPNTKVSDMTALTGLASAAGDLIPIIDVSETGAAKNKNITRDQLVIGLQKVTTAILASDFVTSVAADAGELVTGGLALAAGTYFVRGSAFISRVDGTSGDTIVAPSTALASPATSTGSLSVACAPYRYAPVSTSAAGATPDAAYCLNDFANGALQQVTFEGWLTLAAPGTLTWAIQTATWNAGDAFTMLKGALIEAFSF